MNVFCVPPHKNFFESLVAGVKTKFGADKQVQYLVFNDRDKRSMQAAEVTSLADIDIDNVWPIDIQLELASAVSHQSAEEKNALSSRNAITLAPELLKVALQCKADEISPDDLRQVLVGNAPKHIEDLITHLPSAIQMLENYRWTPRLSSSRARVSSKQSPIAQQSQSPTKEIDEAFFVGPDLRVREDDNRVSPIFIIAPDRVSISAIRQIKEMVQYSNVHLVLKPIDMALSNDCWRQIEDIHPSFQQKQLLEQLGITRDQIKCLTEEREDINFVSMLFHPASYLAEWAKMSVPRIHSVQYAECRSIREEGLIVLIQARQMLEKTGKPVTIICDDDKMIKVLLCLSDLFELGINITQSIPLRETRHINFLELIFQAAYTNFAPAQLAALLRHELFELHETGQDTIVMLERKYLRGLCSYDGLDELVALVNESDVTKLLNNLRAKFTDLCTQGRHETIEFSSLLASVIKVAMSCSNDQASYDSLNTQYHKIRIAPSEFLSALHSLIAKHRPQQSKYDGNQVAIVPSANSLACLHDNVIITGLNEGAAAMDDGLLPAISKFIGLGNVERSEHIRARCLFHLLHKPNVLLTRAHMLAGSPQTPSRWLMRLKLLEKKAGLNLNAQSLIDEAVALYKPQRSVHYDAPAPSPKLTPRLTKLSVTQVEQLMRDPYSVYAKQLLGLQPLDELDRAPTQADFGQFVHACINAFSKNYDASRSDRDQVQEFNRYAYMIATRMIHKPDARRLWMIRTDKIAEWIINFERSRHDKKIYTEIKGSMNIPLTDGANFTLTCVADRIEVYGDQVSIIDFKTGALPTDKDVASYLSPQLSLEALILMHGGFEGVPGLLHLHRLTYIRLSPGSQFGKVADIKGDLQKIVEEAKRGLVALIEFYNNSNTPFAVAKVGKLSRYAHLERLDELRQ